jgi:hypothetical protein
MAMWATGCSGEREQSVEPGSAAVSAQPSPEATRTTKAHPADDFIDPLTAAPATPPYGTGSVASIAHAGDGTNIVVFEPTWPSQRTSYRLYDRNWRPRTPVLRVPVSLEVQRGTARRFVGRASLTRQNGSAVIDEWVTINRQGHLQSVANPPGRAAATQSPRPADLYLQGYTPTRSFAYRPATDTILRVPRPAWLTNRWTVYANPGLNFLSNPDGMICALRSGPVSDGALRVSTDEGRTFTDVPVSMVMAAASGPRLQACLTTAERIVVSTGGESPRWLHTLDRTGRLISSQELGGMLDPYTWGALPDGRLVTGTSRPGLMVATDSTNTLMDYRPGPVPVGWGAQIVGSQLIVARGGSLHVSKDAGLTWQEFDLRLP